MGSHLSPVSRPAFAFQNPVPMTGGRDHPPRVVPPRVFPSWVAIPLAVALAAVPASVARVSVAQNAPVVRNTPAVQDTPADADPQDTPGDPNVAESRREGWKSVDQAIEQGLPRTAIEKLQPLIENAMRDNAHAEAIRGISLKIVLEAETEGNGTETKVTRMRAEIARAPAEMRPVMEAILANWLWQYFRENRWRFLQRTPIETRQTPAQPERTPDSPDSDDWDLATWDLPRILGEVDRQFDLALSEAETLQTTPVERFDALFEEGTAGDTYRPTLYDVLAHNALRFYSAGEQAAVPDPDPMVLDADGPIFAPAKDFLAWRPDADRDPAGDADDDDSGDDDSGDDDSGDDDSGDDDSGDDGATIGRRWLGRRGS